MRDLRKYARQTNIRLIAGALLLLFIVGDGLIYWIYGPSAATMGMLCILAGLAPLALVLLAIFIMDWIANRVDRD